MHYRCGGHTVYQIEYHFVWVTKSHYRVLRGEIGLRVKELVRQTREAFGSWSITLSRAQMTTSGQSLDYRTRREVDAWVGTFSAWQSTHRL